MIMSLHTKNRFGWLVSVVIFFTTTNEYPSHKVSISAQLFGGWGVGGGGWGGCLIRFTVRTIYPAPNLHHKSVATTGGKVVTSTTSAVVLFAHSWVSFSPLTSTTSHPATFSSSNNYSIYYCIRLLLDPLLLLVVLFLL